MHASQERRRKQDDEFSNQVAHLANRTDCRSRGQHKFALGFTGGHYRKNCADWRRRLCGLPYRACNHVEYPRCRPGRPGLAGCRANRNLQNQHYRRNGKHQNWGGYCRERRHAFGIGGQPASVWRRNHPYGNAYQHRCLGRGFIYLFLYDARGGRRIRPHDRRHIAELGQLAPCNQPYRDDCIAIHRTAGRLGKSGSIHLGSGGRAHDERWGRQWRRVLWHVQRDGLFHFRNDADRGQRGYLHHHGDKSRRRDNDFPFRHLHAHCQSRESGNTDRTVQWFGRASSGRIRRHGRSHDLRRLRYWCGDIRHVQRGYLFDRRYHADRRRYRHLHHHSNQGAGRAVQYCFRYIQPDGQSGVANHHVQSTFEQADDRCALCRGGVQHVGVNGYLWRDRRLYIGRGERCHYFIDRRRRHM